VLSHAASRLLARFRQHLCIGDPAAPGSGGEATGPANRRLGGPGLGVVDWDGGAVPAVLSFSAFRLAKRH